ncbi:hypothetical protein J6590_106004, partial [Homalodisca vitripennis]
MAAKIGSALLEENKLLKEHLAVLENKLACAQCHLASSEARIEEFTSSEDKYLSRIAALTQELSDLQSIIQKEKHKNKEIQKIFEDHDKQQEKLNKDQITRIKYLETQNSQLNKELYLKESEQLKTKTTIENGTQTTTSFTPMETKFQSLPNIILELAQMKSRQDNMEITIKSLNDQLNSRSTFPYTPILHEQSTQSAMIPTQTASRSR